MGVPKTFADGEGLIAADVNKYLNSPYTVVKSADETINNSIAVQNDDHLVITVPADPGGVNKYLLTGFVLVTGSGTPDMYFQWQNTGLSIWYSVFGPATVATSMSAAEASDVEGRVNPDNSIIAIGNTGALAGVHIFGYVEPTTVAVPLQLQWAQNVATVANTLVKKGSWLRLEKTY